MAQYSEYSNTAVQGSACSYATLSNYYRGSGSQGLSAARALGPAAHTVTPQFGAPGYNVAPQQQGQQQAYSALSRAYQQPGPHFMQNLCQ